MKNTKRKSVMLLPETWKLLEESSKLTNLSASEVVNELIQMYWHRWTQHRLKRLEPYKKTEKKAPETRTPEPELDENVQDPQQDSNDYDKQVLEDLEKELEKADQQNQTAPKQEIEIQPRNPNGGEDDLF